MSGPRSRFLMALAVFAAASRLLPHPPNFAPTTAVALFGAMTFASRRSALLVSFGSLLASDALLHLTYLVDWQPNWGFYQGQWVVYSCTLVTMLIGSLLRRKRNAVSIAAATFVSSLFFFLATNFAVWASGSEMGYPKTLAGLVVCYEGALPFWRHSLIGDVFYTGVLFGSLALAEARFPGLRPVGPGTAVP